MLNDKLIGKSSMSRKNYLLVDVDLLRKEELAQRRKLRIQQVRLQSKDLANRMLQDVRNERNRQLKVMQSKQTDSFKKWQSRKIHEINLKYKENVNVCGASQRAAAELPDPEKEILEQAKKNTEIAHKRGRVALDQLKIEKEMSREQQEKCVAQREKVKKLENVRASIVSSLSAAGEKKKSPQKFVDATNDAEEEPEHKCVEMQSNQDINVPPIIPQLHLDEASTERKTRKAPNTYTKRTVSDAEVPNSIEFYDRHNPCTITQRQPPSVRVERQSPTSQTNAREAAEMEEREEAERNVLSKGSEEEIMRHKRGKKALAKEMVRRDYDRLLSCLDGLARTERLARGMGNPKVPPETFMNEERTASKAHTRQQNLESAFEGVLHGNEAVKLREDPPLPSKPLSPPPIVIEKANFPPEWLEVREFTPHKPETPPPKLNMGVCDEVSVSSTSGYEAESSQSSHHSSVKLDEMNSCDVEPDNSPKEIIHQRPPEKKTMPVIMEDKGENEIDAPEKYKRRVKRPVKERKVQKEPEAVDEEAESHALQTMQVDEENIISMGVDKATSPVWWCSLDSEQIMSQNTLEGRGSEKKGSNVFVREIRKITAIQEDTGRSETVEQRISCLQRRRSDVASPDAKSSESEALSSSSLSIEEIHVKVKFDKSPSIGEPLDEKVGRKHRVPQSPKQITFNRKSHKERKKKTSRGEQPHKPKKMLVPEGLVEDAVKVPEAEEKLLVDKEKVDSVSVETQTKMESPPKTERKIKRDKKETRKKKAGLPSSSSDSSYLSPPKHLDISDSDRAKVLLEEIRAQRKRLEDWVGFNQAEKTKRDPRVGDYVKKLLTMSRESIENLSVSDVSTPTIHRHSPVVLPSSPRKEVVSEKKCEDKSVGTSFDEEMKRSDVEEEKIRKPMKEPSVVDTPDFKEPPKVKSRSNSPIETSSSTSSGSVSEVLGSDRLRRGPGPPPPSPEFDELSVFHSKRISELGAKLMELRETKKRILIAPNLSDRESTSSHRSPDSSSGSERISTSPEKSVASYRSVVSPSSEESGPRKSWELLLDAGNNADETEILHPKNVSSDDSEGLSVLGEELLESIRLLEPKTSFKPSEELKAAQKMWSSRNGLPPPTAMKGGIWIGNEFQVPHELSTITEVDSKLLSTTSVLEPRKEKDSSTAGIRIQPHPEPSEDMPPKEKTPEVSLSELSSLIMASAKAFGLTSPEKESPEARMPFQDLGNEREHVFANIEDLTKIAEISGLEEVSDASLSFSSSSSDENSSKFPSNIDDVLRMLGISPTIFQGRKSPTSQDNRSSPASPNIKMTATQFKDQQSTTDYQSGNVAGGPSSIAGTRVGIRDKVIHSTPYHQLRDAADVSSSSRTPGTKGGSNKETIDPVKDSEKLHSEAQFTPIHLFADSSVGTAVGRRSPKLDVEGVRQTAISEDPGRNLSSLLFTSAASLRDFTLNATPCSVSEIRSKVKGSMKGAADDDSRLHKPEVVLQAKRQGSPEKSFGELLHVTKGELTPASLLRHSTPVHSSSGLSSSSSTESHSKSGGGGFPYFGDSAPSSISAGNSSGGRSNWRNLEDEDDNEKCVAD